MFKRNKPQTTKLSSVQQLEKTTHLTKPPPHAETLPRPMGALYELPGSGGLSPALLGSLPAPGGFNGLIH